MKQWFEEQLAKLISENEKFKDVASTSASAYLLDVVEAGSEVSLLIKSDDLKFSQN